MVINDELKESGFDFDLANLALELCQNEIISLKEDAENSLISKHQLIKVKLPQDSDYQNWIWNDEDYMDNRANSGLILDLLGYGRTLDSENELNESISFYSDTRIKYFAIISAARRNLPIKASDIEELASEDETRGLMYNYLKSSGKIHLFPDKYNNQGDLSKADMVNWLIYPTELARVPTKIELIKVITLEFDDVGLADFYLWKFMADDEDWKENGWMVGLSGAFLKSESPTMDSHGYTFSAFTKFEEKTPDEHFEQIMGIMEEWNNSNN